MKNEGDGIGVLQLGYLGFWSIPVVPSSIIMIIKVVMALLAAIEALNLDLERP